MNYHKDLGFPDTLTIPNVILHLQYTLHAQDRKTREGKYNELKVLPTIIRTNPSNIFEIETEDNVYCKKILIRIGYDYKRDITLVLEPLSSTKAKVITFWLNNKGDKHKNFNKDKYTIPDKNNSAELDLIYAGK